MAGFIRDDLIVQKLEIARSIGLLTDYRIGEVGPFEATVRVWHGSKAPDSAVSHYLAGLLNGLVAEHDIIVMPAQPVIESPALEAPLPQAEPIQAPVGIPVAA